MNVYELSRRYWDWSFENPDKIKPNHSAMFFFAIEHCNRLGWKEKFGFPTTMVMEAIGVKSYNTFIATLNDLVTWGFINMIEKSKNQYSANIIAISKFNEALDEACDKALDEALMKHTTKQSESTEQSIVESIDSIDKQTYNTTILQTYNTTEENLKMNSSELFESNKQPDEMTSKKVAQKKVSKIDLEMPDDFVKIWEEWNQYRKDKKIKSYAGPKWEQIAVEKLLELSNRDPATAKLILKQTYENNYQGFFPLKQNFNGQSNNNSSNNGFSNQNGNSSRGYPTSGKVSASSILARQAREQSAGNGESGNFTVQAEVVE